MNRSPAGTVAAPLLAAAALALAGCSSSGPSTPRPVASTPAPRPSSPASQTPASSPPSTPPASSPPASAGADAARLTPTGTTLRVGRKARVRYELDTASKQSSVLALGVTSVKRGSIADLKDFKLDAQSKTGVPFYVTAEFTNVGNKTIKPSGIFGTIDARNSAGDEVTALNLIGDFPKCDGIPPDSLAPGKSFTECQVYVAPAGQVVTTVVYDHFVELEETQISWAV